jgi:thiol-disulfide isomerase/thioredoxin
MNRPKFLTTNLIGLLVVLALFAGVAGLYWHQLQDAWRGPAPEPQRDVPVTLASMGGVQGPELDFQGAAGWLNTAGPIRPEELRGKIVLLDFWTYCCINCHHVLPDLAKLEEKYKNELVVIGVHTPKFLAERDTENIRKKIHEYGIKHPVISDANQIIWRHYNVAGWPTLALFDTNGRVIGAISGEGHYAVLDKVIGNLVQQRRADGTLNETPLKFFPENEKIDSDNDPLLFPGKVLADAASQRLFISDTGHNRIVITDLDGKHPTTIGNGESGLVDGGYDKAQFNRQQGMCLVGETLYVADTENHAIRAVDLKAKTVTTVAGTGQQSQERRGSGEGTKFGLNSPWDVVQVPGTSTLLIAMAGPHQIWSYDTATRMVSVVAGSGMETILDGPPDRAAFAQPSGLATDGKTYFVADSEVSGVRTLTLGPGAGRVGRIVGRGLFDFGDVDGQAGDVRLQHCLGLAFADGKLYIADTYNNKIKVCDPASRTVKTLSGDGQPGDTNDPPRYYQPGGLSVAGSTLYVADTNNGHIRAIDLKTGQVRTLALEGLTPPRPRVRVPSFPGALVTNTPTVQVAPGSQITLDVNLQLKSGEKVNPEAPMPVLIEAPDQPGLLVSSISPTGQKVNPPATTFPLQVELAKPAQAGDSIKLRVSVGAFVCDAGSNLCRIRNFIWNVPVTFDANGKKAVTLDSSSQTAAK